MPATHLSVRRVPSSNRAELGRLRAVLRSSYRRRSPEVEERRRDLERFADRMPNRRVVDVESAEVGGVLGEWVGPASPSAVLYFHGGGYVLGSPSTHREIGARLAEAAEMRVFTPGYRLAPEHPFPAAFEDGLRVWEEVSGAIGHGNVVLAGDSAGGGLALALAADLVRRKEPCPAAVFAFSPWTDLTHGAPSIGENRDRDAVVDRTEVEEMAARYLRGHDPRDSRASPLFARHDGFPPLRILVSDAESLRDDGVRFAESASASGAAVDLEIWEGQPHAWPIYAPILEDGDRAIRETGEWVRRVLGS